MAIVSPTNNPNRYSLGSWLGASTSTGEAVDFGFNASYLRVENLGTETVYLGVGTSGATTADYPFSTGEVLTLQNVLTRDLSVSRNTTTTDLTGLKVHALG